MYYSLKHKLPHLVESTILKQEILPRLLSLTSTLRHKFDNPEKESGVRIQKPAGVARFTPRSTSLLI